MSTISLCMIVKDEASVLSRCLESVLPLVDEVILVDTGSTDSTREIAASYGQVYDFTWCDHFAKARNFSFSKATQDYILWLDADDVLPKESLDILCQYKKHFPPQVDVVMLPYHLQLDAQGQPGFVYYRERILRRSRGFQWQGAVHECISPQGEIVYLPAPVEHHKLRETSSFRNLQIYERELSQQGALDTRSTFYYGRELLTHHQYQKAQQQFQHFLTRPDGWVENQIEACLNLSTCWMAQGQLQEAKQALLSSLLYDSPRAEICCALGDIELQSQEPERAKFWYHLALDQHPTPQRGGFVRTECYGYLPCLGLCLCHHFLHQPEEALKWNEKAALFQPNSPAVIHNRHYFSQL